MSSNNAPGYYNNVLLRGFIIVVSFLQPENYAVQVLLSAWVSIVTTDAITVVTVFESKCRDSQNYLLLYIGLPYTYFHCTEWDSFHRKQPHNYNRNIEETGVIVSNIASG